MMPESGTLHHIEEVVIGLGHRQHVNEELHGVDFTHFQRKFRVDGGAFVVSHVFGPERFYVFACVLFFSVLLGIFGLLKFVRLVLDVPDATPAPHSPEKG